MRQVRYHPLAQSELLREVAYFAAISPRLAEHFDAAVQAAEVLAARSPESWPPYLGGTRRVIDRRFKFSLVFRHTEHELWVVAIAAARRRPGYWQARSVPTGTGPA